MSGQLGETLRELSEQLPDRVDSRALAYQVMVDGNWHVVWARLKVDREWQQNPVGLWALENALREECEARGWDWHTDGNPSWGETARRSSATIFRPGDGPSYIHHAYADTPAHAFALSLLDALRGRP